MVLLFQGKPIFHAGQGAQGVRFPMREGSAKQEQIDVCHGLLHAVECTAMACLRPEIEDDGSGIKQDLVCRWCSVPECFKEALEVIQLNTVFDYGWIKPCSFLNPRPTEGLGQLCREGCFA